MSNKSDKSLQIWIGLAHVRIPSGTTGFPNNVKGGYVNVVALARDLDDFRIKIERCLSGDNIYLTDLEDAADLASYDAEGRISDDIRMLLEMISIRNPIEFDVFQIYSRDDS